MFILMKKESGIIPQMLTSILDECVNGITLADPDLEDCPVVYANRSFEQLTGYQQEEIIGINCRFLQGKDTDQEARKKIRNGIENRVPIEVTLRNYKKDGTLFHNHLKITPLFDKKDRLIYLLGVQYDITYQINAENEINKLNAQLSR